MSSMDPYNLNRFLETQKDVYENVLAELESGRKTSHWMWFIFPQVRGLGHTETSIFYAISDLPEAKAYLGHPVLGARLRTCAALLLRIEGKSATQILGTPDDLKLKSSMTLFALTDTQTTLFGAVLQKYFGGKSDPRTLEVLRLREVEVSAHRTSS